MGAAFMLGAGYSLRAGAQIRVNVLLENVPKPVARFFDLFSTVCAIAIGVYFTSRVNGHHAVVRPPMRVERGANGLRDDVARVTAALAGELEGLIRRAPEQWHLFQPNWPSDPGY